MALERLQRRVVNVRSRLLHLQDFERHLRLEVRPLQVNERVLTLLGLPPYPPPPAPLGKAGAKEAPPPAHAHPLLPAFAGELLITLLQDDQPRSLVCWVPQVGANPTNTSARAESNRAAAAADGQSDY